MHEDYMNSFIEDDIDNTEHGNDILIQINIILIFRLIDKMLHMKIEVHPRLYI